MDYNYAEDLVATFDADFDHDRVYQFVRRHYTLARMRFLPLARAALKGKGMEREFHKIRATARFTTEGRQLASQLWLEREPVLEEK